MSSGVVSFESFKIDSENICVTDPHKKVPDFYGPCYPGEWFVKASYVDVEKTELKEIIIINSEYSSIMLDPKNYYELVSDSGIISIYDLDNFRIDNSDEQIKSCAESLNKNKVGVLNRGAVLLAKANIPYFLKVAEFNGKITGVYIFSSK